MGELVARVSALGRRYPEEPALKLRVGDLTLDLEPGRVFTRTELCERVWEHPHEYDTKLVEVFIGRLRRTIGRPPLIHTVRHVGYTIREAS
jgi:DNA-binding response OmpR family regulator